jgi:hypothetical protein
MYFARYGWVALGEEVTGLEDEYQLSGGLPRLVYIKAPAPNRESRLAKLLSRIRDEDTVSYKTFGSTEELQQLLREDWPCCWRSASYCPLQPRKPRQCRPRPCTGPHQFLGR